MPSSPPSVRPVLAALLTALLLASSVLAGAVATPAAARTAGSTAAATPVGAATTGTGASTSGASPAPAVPPTPGADDPVALDLVELSPTSLAPGGTVQAQVEVTNTSSEPLSAVELELRTRSARVTDRDLLAEWQADTSPDTVGTPLATSAAVPSLAPGESATLSVTLSADELGFSAEPYYWGTRRVSLTVAADGEDLAALRSFLVWRPDGAEDSITQSVLLPVSAADASAAVTAPESFATSVESGELAALRELAVRPDVDWWLDPALLDPPQVAQGDATAVGTDGQPTEEAPPSAPRTFAPDAPSASLAESLTGGVGERTVLGMPYARADLVSLQAASDESLTAAATSAAERVWAEQGLEEHGTVLSLAAESATGQSLLALQQAGASAALVPASSLRPDPSSSLTPSSVAAVDLGDGTGSPLTVLAPDSRLSAELETLTADGDAEQTRQRMLAETATIASEFTVAPRHLLISPDPEATLDPAATATVLDALGEAPWITVGRTDDLISAAEQETWTQDPQDESGELYAIGEIPAESVVPSAPDAEGRWQHQQEAVDAELLTTGTIDELSAAWEELDVLAAVMEDDTSLEAARLEVLAATSERWRGHPEVSAERAAGARTAAADLRAGIHLDPASGYNLISDSAGVPVTIVNELDTPITVRAEVSSDKPLVRVEEHPTVTVPARGQIDTTVPVEAIANGTVTLTTRLTTEDGRALTDATEVPLTVNPAWENWTTLVLVIAMGVLVVVGIARARRVGASTRAPAVHVPEDPEELARTGRSTPAVDPGSPPDPGPAHGPDPDPDQDPAPDDPTPRPDDRPEETR
ncbi:DUF6049 family protein [Brachybacterium sp. J153]|uniref:DUF6049 family protein n=1 Tax=Brachybacterium sp. J153 TaxID=3116488 RepID=UPI002E7A89D3|nr:DUF6049 family protein [Brachybacterium sp. J153]MEE1618535.1 DUF6049 family protein [Brachybacterium sp. J153]